jgi:nucleotide-binding universal stress UspA family protein
MFKKVLFPIEIYDEGGVPPYLPQVIDAVQRWHAELLLLHVLPGFGMSMVGSYFPAEAVKHYRERAAKALRDILDQHVPQDVKASTLLREGTAYEEILSVAQSEHVDLIVMPSADRPGISRWVPGSTAQKVVYHAHCSVLVLRRPAEESS